jgi:NAD(P)H-dependent flavin oxidoreductase YrpB (nitropropane dioxygenase family)
MWYKTKLTDQLGIQYPIIQGPFGGGPSSVKLLSTVSNAGGWVLLVDTVYLHNRYLISTRKSKPAPINPMQ